MAELAVDMLVDNTLAPDWGPGIILCIEDNTAHVFFRDRAERECTMFRLSASCPLVPAEDQDDPLLRHLPPFEKKDGKIVLVGHAPRQTVAQALNNFLHYFPQGFDDPEYYNMERDYKWKAHVQFEETLGAGQGRALLEAGQIEELRRRVTAVEGKVNLLHQFERMALRDGLQDSDAASRVFTAFFALLEAEAITSEVYQPYLDAILQLPLKGKGKKVTWPIATILPFLAQPTRHMFLKPDITNQAADSLAFQLNYSATPNWNTYAALLRMGAAYHEKLQHLAPRDLIDVQSFLWVACGGYEQKS